MTLTEAAPALLSVVFLTCRNTQCLPLGALSHWGWRFWGQRIGSPKVRDLRGERSAWRGWDGAVRNATSPTAQRTPELLPMELWSSHPGAVLQAHRQGFARLHKALKPRAVAAHVRAMRTRSLRAGVTPEHRHHQCGWFLTPGRDATTGPGFSPGLHDTRIELSVETERCCFCPASGSSTP